MSKWERTGYDYVPVPGETYHPKGKKEEGETVKILNEDAVNALVEDRDGNTRVVPKGWLRR